MNPAQLQAALDQVDPDTVAEKHAHYGRYETADVLLLALEHLHMAYQFARLDERGRLGDISAEALHQVAIEYVAVALLIRDGYTTHREDPATADFHVPAGIDGFAVGRRPR